MTNFAVMNRIIGIDYGNARTGIAVSDPLGIFASPLETVTSAKIIEYLQNYARTETIVRFVVGYPLNLDGRLDIRRCRFLPEHLGAIKTETFDKFACRMIEHEFSHLDGELFTDIVAPIRRKMIGKKLLNIAQGKIRTSYKSKIK